MRWITLVVLALLLTTLAPPVNAAPPSPKAWKPYDVATAITNLTMSSNCRAVAAATVTPVRTPTPGVGAPSASIPADLAILDSGIGFGKNGTNPTGGPFGRNFTAVSSDGSAVASVGLDTTPVLGTTQSAKVRLYYQKIASGAHWQADTAEQNVTIALGGGVPKGLLLSTDGTKLALAVQEDDTHLLVQGFTAAPTALTSQFSYRVTGNVSSIAATPDLGFVVVAGNTTEATGNHALLAVIPFALGTPSITQYDRTVNNSLFTTAAITKDGTRIYAGDDRGNLRVFTGGNPAAPLALPKTGRFSQLAIAEDGSRLAITLANTLVVLDGTSAPPSLIYTAPLGGAPLDLAMNRTGATIMVAIKDVGAWGFGDVSADALWKIAATITHVALDAEATTAAYSTAQVVAVTTIQRGLTLEHAGGGDTGPALGIRPSSSGTFQLNVRNSGAALERVEILGPAGNDVKIVADPAVLTVAPDTTGVVNVTVTPSAFVLGSKSFNVTARSLTSAISDETTLAILVRDAADVRLVLNGTNDVAMKPGDTRTVLLGVLNTGGTDAAVGVRASPSALDWTTTVDPASLTLSPNSVTTVRVTVTAPIDAKDGSFNSVDILLEGTNVSDQARLTFRINPTLGVDVSATGRSKFVEPGGVAYYNVTIVNTGTLPRKFIAFYEAHADGGKTWAVDMDTGDFRLDPARSRTVAVRVFAPQDAVPDQDRVTVLVRARSFPEAVNETLAEGNVTLFAIAVPKVTTTTTTPAVPIPGPTALATLVAVGGAALLASVRRHQK